MKKDYIIVLKEKITKQQLDDLIKKNAIRLKLSTFKNLKRHYRVSFDDWRRDNILSNEIVLAVEESNTIITLMANQLISIDEKGQGGNWGLTRLNHRNNWDEMEKWYPNEGTYSYTKTGSSVDVYVIDSGINASHSDFNDNNFEIIYDYFNNKKDPMYGIDTHGHGTHVSSIIAGNKYGVAKQANIIVARAFEQTSTTLDALISNIDACIGHHLNKKHNRINRPSIMNLSLGGPLKIVEEYAINDCINAGIVCIAAAGNEGKAISRSDTDNKQPMYVGSIDIQDYISSFSNYGSFIDIFAPGHYISGASVGEYLAEEMCSGTSFAAPHVSGVCALFLEQQPITSSHSSVKRVFDWLSDNATYNALHLNDTITATGTPNKILYSYYIETNEENNENPVTPVIDLSDIVPENAEDLVKQKGWWKDTNRNWLNQNGSHYYARLINELDEKYDSLSYNEEIEINLRELDVMASELIDLRKQAKVKKYAEFLVLYNHLVSLVQ